VATFLWFGATIAVAACRRLGGLSAPIRAMRLGLLASLIGAGLRMVFDY